MNSMFIAGVPTLWPGISMRAEEGCGIEGGGINMGLLRSDDTRNESSSIRVLKEY